MVEARLPGAVAFSTWPDAGELPSWNAGAPVGQRLPFRLSCIWKQLRMRKAISVLAAAYQSYVEYERLMKLVEQL